MYEIELAAGQYLHVSVDQRSVDVAVVVAGPGQAAMFRVDHPYGTLRPEQVHLVAETPGRYHLEMRPSGDAGHGRYRLELEALRPASVTDRRRAAAERAFWEARWNLQAAGFWERVAKLEKALRLFRELGAKEREAEAYYRIGELYLVEKHDPREALGMLGTAHAIYGRLHDDKFIALSDNQIGRSYVDLGEPDRATTFFERALGEWYRQPLTRGRATTLENLAELHGLRGEATAALRLYREAIGVRHQLADTAGEATALIHLGWIYRTVGEWDRALAAVRQALELCRGAHPHERAVALNEMGDVYLDAEEPQLARPCFLQALELQSSGGDPETKAASLSSLGISYRRLAEYGNALAVDQEAREMFRKAGNRQSEANAWINLGSAYGHMQQPQRAAECYRMALRLARATGYRATEAQALLGIAIAARDRGNLPEALIQAEAAIRLVEILRTDTSRPDLQASSRAINEDYYEVVMETLMRLHATQPARGFDMRALQYSEQARARGLLDTLIARHASRTAPTSFAAALLAERHRLDEQIATKDREALIPGVSGAAREALQQQLQGLLEQSQDLSERLRRAGASPATSGDLFRALAQREQLDDRTLLLEYYMGIDQTLLWAVTSHSIASFELPGHDHLEPLLRSVYQQLSSGDRRDSQDFDTGQVERLSRVLLGPLGDRLDGRRLLIVANGALQYIPFGALPDPRDPGAPLMLRHEIVYAPSLAVLSELRAGQGTRARPPGLAAVLADPVFGAQDERARGLKVPPAALDAALAALPRVPHSRDEAAAIASFAGGQEVLLALGFDANTELVTKGHLRRYRILHFATHGTLRLDRPELSALALSQIDRTGKPRDGLLRALEIENLDLPADLVVLSACKTALGKELGGEGLVGLPQGFMRAGAQRVLVSLWDVGDRSTAALMRRFYQSLLVNRLPAAAALRAAQRATWQDPQTRSPYYWGAFVLQGDWR